MLGTFGATNLQDIPVPGDYDGLGRTEMAVFRPSTAQWIVLGPSGGRILATYGATSMFDDPTVGPIGSLKKIGRAGGIKIASISAAVNSGFSQLSSSTDPGSVGAFKQVDDLRKRDNPGVSVPVAVSDSLHSSLGHRSEIRKVAKHVNGPVRHRFLVKKRGTY